MRKLKVEELKRLSPEEFQRAAKTPLVLVLDNVRSGLNVGSAFRTADAFALERVLLCGITAQPPHREILKTALGASETLPWRYFPQTRSAVEALKEEGFAVWGVEQTDASLPLQEFHWQPGKKYALVFGNEVRGISEDILPLLDGCLEVPQFGTKHSLNIAVCVGIVAWELFRQWKFQQFFPGGKG